MFKTKEMIKTGLLSSRMKIRSFKTSDAMYDFIAKESDRKWGINPPVPYDGPLKTGTYAFAGGNWHNVKTLDPSVLAHI